MSAIVPYKSPKARGWRGYDTRRSKRGKLATVSHVPRTLVMVRGPDGTYVAEEKPPRTPRRARPRRRAARAEAPHQQPATATAPRKARKKPKRPRSPAQKAATKRMLEANKAAKRAKTQAKKPAAAKKSAKRARARAPKTELVCTRRRVRQPCPPAAAHRTKPRAAPRAKPSTTPRTRPRAQSKSVEALRAEARIHARGLTLVKPHKSASPSCKLCKKPHTLSQHWSHRYGAPRKHSYRNART